MSEYGLWFWIEEGWFCYYGTAYNPQEKHTYKTYQTNSKYYWPTKYKDNIRLSGDCLGRWLDGEED